MKRNIKEVTTLIQENNKKFIPIVELCKRTTFYKKIKKTHKSTLFIDIPEKQCGTNFSLKVYYTKELYDTWTIPTDVCVIPKWIKRHLKRWGFGV